MKERHSGFAGAARSLDLTFAEICAHSCALTKEKANTPHRWLRRAENMELALPTAVR